MVVGRLPHLVVQGEQRVERGHRVLQDHADLVAPDVDRGVERALDRPEVLVALTEEAGHDA